MKKVCILMAVGVLLCAGCSSRLIDFTVISSKNVDLSRAGSFQRGQHRVKGVDTAHWIIIFPTGVPNAKEALDRAIESVPGTVALTDGVITSKSWYIPYIYGQSKYIVEGTPLIVPTAGHNNSDIRELHKRHGMTPVLPEDSRYDTIEETIPEEHERESPDRKKTTVDRLKELQQLKNSGIITEGEYQTKRSKIIDAI